MNQPFNHPVTTRDASYAVPLRQRRSAFSRPWRVGLMALNLVGVLLVSMVIFALLPVAHVMSMTEHQLTRNGQSVIEVVAIPLATPTPQPPPPTQPSIDTTNLSVPLLPNTLYMLQGMGPSSARMRLFANAKFLAETTSAPNGQWSAIVIFTEGAYTLLACVVIGYIHIACSEPVSILVIAPTPTSTSTPMDPNITPTPTPVP